MKKVFFFLGVLCTSWAVPAQKLPGDSAAWNVQMEEILVLSTRAGSRTPVAFSQVRSAEINQNNAAANLPYVLSLTPSLVAVSENGTPAGNTSLRIRGSSSSRINVTLNGIPMNDAESQEVFWVNLPALSYSLRNVQVQRGVGTSTNGPASFGGALNLQSLGNSVEGYGMASTGIGSYHTYESSLAFGTGMMKSGLSMDFRYSKVLSDGYVRNGKVNHQSLFTSFSYRSAKSLLRFHYILGDQHTGITWEGSSPSMIEQDRRYNPAGIYYDDAGNIRYYDNETDNYRQNLFQLL
ncbi:MAG: TonB-dependent receptor, partial [Bacteroidales bacterium]|nr:TonB-dependent receptor [Bacteroidales bacterium]